MYLTNHVYPSSYLSVVCTFATYSFQSTISMNRAGSLWSVVHLCILFFFYIHIILRQCLSVVNIVVINSFQPRNTFPYKRLFYHFNVKYWFILSLQ